MTKKISKRLLGFVLALAMVLSFGTTNAFAAENTEKVADKQITSRASVYSNSWSFKHQRDSSNFYASAGQSVSITMSGIHSSSSQGFYIQVCRIVNGNVQTYGGPIHVDANKSIPYTITFGIYDNGTYLIRGSRTNDGIYQNIDSIIVNLAG